ncbi:MAG TPA: hypothetical protein VIV54_12970 [Burkholderiales bacterium]
MRTILALALGLFLAASAFANPALHGTWSAADVEGKPLLVEFAAGGTGQANGQPIRWSTLGGALFIQQNGQTASYGFKVQGDKLLVYPQGQMQPTVLSKGSAAYDAAMKAQPKTASPAQSASPAKAGAQSSGQELVGKWCDMGGMSTYQGSSSRMACIELRADGTYTYNAESSRSVNTSTVYGGTASQSSDAGRWTYNGSQLIAQSRSGQTTTYNLEKRNHPKNKRDPMICLNGSCFVTYYNKPAW